MSIKILGGVAKGFSLATPQTTSTRPTSVMLKRKIFDSIQDFSDSIFIDLCAGTGSIGLEAASRNSEKTILVENHPKIINILKQNTISLSKKYNLQNIQVEKKDAINWLKNNIKYLNDLDNVFLFFDPPYEKIRLYEEFFELVTNLKNITIIVEACEQKTMKIEKFESQFGKADKVFKQGTSYFSIFNY